MSDPALFTFGETELAGACGVQVKHFQKTRQKNLAAGADFDLVHLRIAYTRAGAAAALDLVTGSRKGLEGWAELLDRLAGEIEKKAAPESVDALVKRFFLNPHLMAVELPGKAVVQLRVKETKNFRVGMIVPVREVTPGRYELAKKLPRYPGRF